MLFSGKIPSNVAARLTRKYWVPNFCHFITIPPPHSLHPYLPLFVTIRHYSRLFATIRTVRTIRYSRLFAVRYSLFATIRYSLFAIRVFQTPGLMAVSALVVSYTVSLFREITAKPATSTGENRTATEDSIPFSFRIVRGFGAYGLYYKGSTFFSFILRS